MGVVAISDCPRATDDHHLIPALAQIGILGRDSPAKVTKSGMNPIYRVPLLSEKVWLSCSWNNLPFVMRS